MSKPTERFTNTVQDYLKYRPSYPKEVLQVSIEECGLKKEHIVADVGSGTGFLTKLWLDNGNTVYGVEPNDAMQECALSYLQDYANFHPIKGTAEATTLPDASIDFITVGTAFHWFDVAKTKSEFQRILKKPGWVLLIWNVRDQEKSNLIRDYEALITQYGTDYRDSSASRFDKTAVSNFFHPFAMQTAVFTNKQQFDWPGFQGRLLSASYSLRPEDKRYGEMIQALKDIYERYQKDGMVEFLYKTKLYFGRLV